MGHASRNNPVAIAAKSGNLPQIKSIRQKEIIRTNLPRAYTLGLISFVDYQFLKTNPNQIEKFIYKMNK